jgi:gliding motility-associated-like protein
MKRILLPFLLLFIYNNLSAQIGAGPDTNCTSSIPEICPGGSYPASITGTATAPGASFSCPGSSPIVGQPAFFFLEIGTAGNIDLEIAPVDQFTGLPVLNDLDFIAWGPFSSTANMCTQLQAVNRIDCSYSSAYIEHCNIIGANVGDIYVIEVSNWDGSGTPNPCNIQFTADTTWGGIENPFAGGGFAGAYTNINRCSTDPIFNLIDVMNGFPDSWGTWIDALNNPVGNTFNPATDPGGEYRYVIGGTTNCPGDTSWLDINLVSGSSMSITSSPSACTDDSPLNLTATPSGGVFVVNPDVNGNGVSVNTFTPDISVLGSNIIQYVYQANGCSDTVWQDLIVNESPTVLAANSITTNPSCFGDCDGSAIVAASLGLGPYNYEWFGENPLALCSGIFNYEVTDANGCTFSSDVTLYDPINNLGVLNSYPSSCFGDNNGSISVTMNAGVTPPGTVSLLSYCQSSSNTADFPGNMDAIIEEVILNGDANNINNNTAGVVDYYEDYTPTMYADITEGQSYTVDLILGDLSGGSYPTGAKVFIDYNIDGDFDDTGEEIGILNCTWVAPLVGSINFTVPSTGAFGPTRMRVVSQDAFMGPTSNIGPCDYADPSVTNANPWFGATEDYSIVLNAPTVTATFLWDNGLTVDSISSLGPGTYIVTITPSNGCSVQDSATVYEPSEITFNPTITEISCNTFSDGVISLNPGGGSNGPYTPNWGANNPNLLGVGSYLVTVTDNASTCTHDTTITMVEPVYFSVDFTTSSNEICLNDPVTLDFNFNQGGVPQFTINYTENGNLQSAGPFNSVGQQQVNVSPIVGNNIYIITSITDSAGCINQNIISSQDIYANPIPDINISVAPNPICVGDNATLLFSAPDGTSPYVVDYLVGGTPASINITGAGGNLPVSPTTTTTYTLNFVTDSKGCTSNLTANTTLIVNELPQVTLTSPTETCDGDVIQLQFNFTAGAAPWMINYDVNGNPPTIIPINNAIDSIAISPSATTTYTINSVTDNNNCVNNIAQTVVISTNPLPEVILSGGGSICADGSTKDINFSITSGTPPYSLQYSAGLNANFVSNIGTIFTVSTDQAGIYTIQSVTDIKGCSANSISGSASVNVNPLPEANITAYPQPADIINPLIHFNDVSNGHVDGLWYFGDGSDSLQTNFGKLTHIYGDTGRHQVSLSIVSDSGCVDIAWQTIIISPVFTIYIPNSFTPNNDLKNDYFLPIVDGVNEYEFSIYDRHGKRIFSTDKYTNEYCITGCDAAWDGKVENSNYYATKGVYIYALVITDINGKLRTFEGAVKLIR